MDNPQRRRAFAVRSISLCGSALMLVSTLLPWTTNKDFLEAFNASIPWGGSVLVACSITIACATTLYFILIKQRLIFFAIQIVSISMTIYIFLEITSFYMDFFNELEIGFFLCGFGIVLCVFEIVIFIVFHPALEPSPIATRPLVQGTETIDLEKKFYEALDHEIRRKILRMIGERGYCTFTEFKKTLTIGTGTLYHHLNILSPLVYQQDNKKYYLTKLGEMTLNFMQDNAPYLGTIKKEDLEGKGSIRFAKLAPIINKFDARRLFARMFDAHSRFARFSIILPLAMFVAGAALGFQDFVFFFPTYAFFNTNALFTPFLQMPAFIIDGVISWFIIWGLIECFCYINFKKKANLSLSFAGCGISFAPLLVYEFIVFGFHVLEIDVPAILSGFFLIMAQFITLYLLVTFQMYQKGLKFEKSLSIVLPAHYLAIFFYLLIVLKIFIVQF